MSSAGCFMHSSVWMGLCTQHKQENPGTVTVGTSPDLAFNQLNQMLPQPWRFWACSCSHLALTVCVLVFFLSRVAWLWPMTPTHSSSEWVRVSYVNSPPEKCHSRVSRPRRGFALMFVAVSVSGALALQFPVTPYWCGPFLQVLPTSLTTSPPTGCSLSLHCPRIFHLLWRHIRYAHAQKRARVCPAIVF